MSQKAKASAPPTAGDFNCKPVNSGIAFKDRNVAAANPNTEQYPTTEANLLPSHKIMAGME